MGILSDTKDRVVERVMLTYLNRSLLQPYGRATNLRIDSRAKTMEIELEIKGESDPVKVHLTDYELTKEGGHIYATLKGIRSSKEWLTTMANQYVLDRPFELPPEAGKLLLRAL